jgi:hypothetical protein
VSVYAVNKLCRRVVHEPELRAALLAGDVGRLSRMGANHFLLHQLGRWKVLGLDLPTYADRIRAAWR